MRDDLCLLVHPVGDALADGPIRDLGSAPHSLALAGDQLYTGVAHAAHLGGLAFGFLYARYDWYLERIVEHFPWLGWKPNTRLRVRRLSPQCAGLANQDLDTNRIDEVLEKISISGQDSLTEEERTILPRRVNDSRLAHAAGDKHAYPSAAPDSQSRTFLGNFYPRSQDKTQPRKPGLS